jgi:hypothetical protein
MGQKYQGTYGPVAFAGTPTAAVNGICTLTLADVTGGTFKLTVTREDGQTEQTAAITWSATNGTLLANIDAALEALAMATGSADFTTADATLSSGLGTLTITLAGLFVGEVTVITVSLDSTTGTGHSVTAEMTTPGVRAAFRGINKGGICVDYSNGKLYINTGTADKPTWTVVGAQS